MQIDVERRKLLYETKLKMKEYEESKSLRKMFTPKINNKKCGNSMDQPHFPTHGERSKSREVVYERLNKDSERR